MDQMFDEMLEQYEQTVDHLVKLNQRITFTANLLAAENAYLHQKVAEGSSMEFTSRTMQ